MFWCAKDALELLSKIQYLGPITQHSGLVDLGWNLRIMLHFKETLQVLLMQQDHRPYLWQILILVAHVRVGHS